MSELDRIVEINITRNTTSIASANFSTPLLLSKTATETVAVFRSAKEVSEAGYAVDSNEYLSALAHFLVENHPPEFKIGKWDSPTDSATEALDKIVAEDNEFYGILIADATTDGIATDYASVAIWADTTGKFVFGGDDDKTGLATLTALNSSGAQNACCMVNTYLRSDGSGIDAWQDTMGYADVAFCSKILGMRIGSYTAVYKKLKGMKADKFTSSEIQAITNLNGCYYGTTYGQDMTEGGRVTDGGASGTGEWVDIEIGIDWLEVRMQEAIFKTITRQAKIPYTDKGTATLETAIEGVLELGVKYGLLASYTISREPVSKQTQEDKANRVYNGLSWNATLAGAIHTTTIYGNVEV
jgi:hypothetical protein